MELNSTSAGTHEELSEPLISVEFFGIPRARAGVSRTECQPGTLGEVLTELARRYPAFGETCVTADGLRAGYLANLNGDQFLIDPQAVLSARQSLLILSADAGG